MRRVVIALFACSSALSAIAQDPQDNFQGNYEQFRQQAKKAYEDFRDKANKDYAEFVRKAWQTIDRKPPIPAPKPKHKDVPPVVILEDVKLEPIKSTPIKIEHEIWSVPKIDFQPIPVAPIPVQPVETEEWVNFAFYGTPMKVRFGKDLAFSVRSCTPDGIADAWELLSQSDYNNTIHDCLKLREEHKLGDWAYLQMLETMAEACVGKGNSAVMLMAYVFCQSGYKMRFATESGQLHMLYSSKHTIYSKEYFVLDGENFYVYGGSAPRVDVCEASFPKEQPLSLWISDAMNLAEKKTEERVLTSKRYPDMKITVSTNKNLIDFFDGYPVSMVGGNFMTKWAMYANMPLEEKISQSLLPQLREKINGLSKKEATERLLNWVQTAFVYEFDDKVWGYDRAFFAEETLYYPYCDCEDRAILFTRLVRDLLGLKCILVYYPGHLASAVCFASEEVKGDYITLDGNRYVVCDPTYIGAEIGRTMSKMDNATATVMLLE